MHLNRRLAVGFSTWVAVMLALAGWSATASAAAGSIAFVREHNIWIAAPDGSNAKQLTSAGGYEFVSAAKGSGAPLLGFSQLTSSGTAYGVLSAAGGAPQALTTKPQPADPFFDANIDAAGDRLNYVWQLADPSVPGGYRPVFAVANVNGTPNLEGGGFAVQNTDFADPGGQTVVWSGLVHGAFSPSNADSCAEGQVGLGIETPAGEGGLDGGQPTEVICPAGDATTQPSASPDGTKIAATVTASGGGNSIIEVFAKANAAPGTALTAPALNASEPDWSPDGTQIAVAGANNTIWTMPAQGGAPTEILTNATRPAWTPYVIPGGAPSPQPGETAAQSTAQRALARSGGASVLIACGPGSGACVDLVRLEVSETLQGSRIVAVSAARAPRRKRRTVVIGRRAVTLAPGQTRTVTISLNSTGKALLARYHRVAAELIVTQGARTVKAAKLELAAAKHRH
jgi:hypothetical protein